MTDPASADAAQPRRRRVEPAALGLLALLTLVWTWWEWQEGAYFGTVLLPGMITLCVIVALLAAFAPWRADRRLLRPTTLALGGLVGLGLWTLLSALWSPAPEIAIEDFQRVLAYALAFGLGFWLCTLLADRVELALTPLAGAAGLIAALTIASMWTGTEPRDLLESDGTLSYPLGYRNATAAFFAIAVFPAVGLAADRNLDWRLRGLALATATSSLNLVLLCQSRTSAPAALIAAVVFILLAPVRLRALAWLALAVLPTLILVGPGLDLYRAVGDDGLASAVEEMHTAGAAAALSAVAALVLGASCARFGSRLPGLGTSGPQGNKAVAGGLAFVAVLGAVAFVAAVGNPVTWVDERLDQFRTGESELSNASSRFGFDTSTNRNDLWRVALDEAGDNPLLGGGAGSFQYAYALKREHSTVDVRDAHSVELEQLSELGVPGLALFLLAVVAAVVGVVRSRRRSPAAAMLGAVALSSGAYWLVHTSVDWFWAYPGVTAPMLAIVGAACAPGALATNAREPPTSGGSWRRWLIAGVAVLAISAVPPFMAERYVNDAYAGWREDAARAYDDLDRARALNPLSDAPLLAEGAIARAAGDEARALGAFREAAAKRPEEWAAHYLLAELQRESNPEVAQNEIGLALELNPLSERVRILARELGVEPPPASG